MLDGWHQVKTALIKLKIKPSDVPPKVNLTEIKSQVPTVLDDDDLIIDETLLIGDADPEDYDTHEDSFHDLFDNLQELLEITKGSNAHDNSVNLREDSDQSTPKGFVSLIRRSELTENEQQYFIRKSTILWMLTDKDEKISVDRLHRFITQTSSSAIADDRSISCGEYIVMRVDDSEKICRVISFKYSNSKYKFKSLSCPINKSDVMVLIQMFAQNESKLVAEDEYALLVELKYYVKHLNVKRKEGSYVICK